MLSCAQGAIEVHAAISHTDREQQLRVRHRESSLRFREARLHAFDKVYAAGDQRSAEGGAPGGCVGAERIGRNDGLTRSRLPGAGLAAPDRAADQLAGYSGPDSRCQ